MKRHIFLIIIFLLLMGFVVNLPTQSSSTKIAPEDIRYVHVGGQNVRVDLAISSEAQERGLSGRTRLADGEGMLFVFDQPGRKMFWMREMNFPIDIIWIAEDMQIIFIERNANPDSFPKAFGPNALAKYVLEVPAGFAEKNNLTVGDPVLFSTN